MSHASHTDHEHADDGAVHAHVSPTMFYVAIFGILVFLTILTVAVSYVHLGPANLAVAVIIASIKASLVVAFFMHLRWDATFNSLALICSLGFIGIFFALTFTDTEWRHKQFNDAQSVKVYATDGKPAPGGMPEREAHKPAAGADKSGHAAPAHGGAAPATSGAGSAAPAHGSPAPKH